MNRFDKFLDSILIESPQYAEGDDHPITIVTKDEYHDYENLNGITYELNSNAENEVISVKDILPTPENMFYSDQIRKYIEYIETGGILESFPVQKDETKLDRYEFFNRINDSGEWWEWAYDFKQEKGIEYDPEDLLNEFDDVFGTNWYHDINTLDIHNIDIMKGDKELADEIGFNQESLIRLKKFFKIMDDYIENESDIEYTLTDMNHRFEAVKEIGVTHIWAEIV